MAVTLNSAGRSNAQKLIRAGKVNADGAWAFSAGDGDALLGDPPDWTGYGKWFLGRDGDADRESKAAWKYPFGKGGEVYVRALRAIISRAGQQGLDAIQTAARELLDAATQERSGAGAEGTRVRLLPRSDFVRALDDGATLDDVGLIKYGAVTIKRGAVDPITGMSDVDTIVSTEDVDRDRDIVYQDGWELGDYRRNPVVLWAHEHRGPPVARSLVVDIDDMNRLITRDRFTPADVNPFGHMIYRMVTGGFINAKSVGFRVLRYEVDEERGGFNLLQNELLEHSYVPVPANPAALVQASASGIDLGPLKEWAARVLDNEPGDARVLCWLPRDTVTRVWQDARAVTGDRIQLGWSGDLERGGNAGGKADGVDGSETSTEEDPDMDKEALESINSLTAAVAANTAAMKDFLAKLEKQHEENTTTDLKDVVSSVIDELSAARTGKLPD